MRERHANKGKQVAAISGSTECGTTPCITMAREWTRNREIAYEHIDETRTVVQEISRPCCLYLSSEWLSANLLFLFRSFSFLLFFSFSPLSLFLSRLMSCSIDRDIFIDKVAPKLCQRWKVCLFFVEEFLIASLRKFYIYIYLGKVLREVGSIVGKWFIEFQEAISSVTKVFDLRNRKFLNQYDFLTLNSSNFISPLSQFQIRSKINIGDGETPKTLVRGKIRGIKEKGMKNRIQIRFLDTNKPGIKNSR